MTWPRQRLGDLAEFRNGLNFPAADRGGVLPVVGVGDFGASRLSDLVGLETVKYPENLAPSALLSEGDLLFVRSNGNPALVGRCMLVDRLTEPTAHSGFTIRARLTSAELSPKWAAAFFQSGHAKRALGLGASGTNISNLSQDILSAVELPVPPRVQQEWCLSLLDRFDRTTRLLETLVDAKSNFKRGLMQELLTGRRRLPEFRSSEAWVSASLGELLTSVVRPVTWDDDATYNLVSIRRRNGGLFARGAVQGANIATKSLFTIETGDFLVSRMQAVHGALAVVPSEFDGHHVSGTYLTLRPRSPARIRTEFLHYLSHLRSMYRNVMLSCHGVHIEKMTFDPGRFLKQRISIPPTLEEQDRITATLRMVDREIDLLERLQAAYASQKRGLMQKLLSGELTVPDADTDEPEQHVA